MENTQDSETEEKFPPPFFFPGDKYKTHCQSEEKGEKKLF